ncbi:MAG: dTDP-4-dehydrorhamnose reductase [Chitinophagaceae bacterium]
MSKPKIIVTGANGQLGNEIRASSVLYPALDFLFLTKEDLAIQETESIKNFFKAHQPQFLINCAAYTAVDRAESEKEIAFLVNGQAAGLLADVCKSFNTKFIHISTDYVFNGLSAAPYKEDDPLDPVNTYGASKLRGEEMVVNYNQGAIIIRTSWVYSQFGNNFVKTMIRLMGKSEKISVVNDQYGSPTYAADLASLLLNIILSGDWIPGIYHYSNEGIITWFNFAEAIKESLKSGCEIIPIPTAAYPTPAKRPVYSVFDTTKIKFIYNVNIPYWRESLDRCISQLNSGKLPQRKQ